MKLLLQISMCCLLAGSVMARSGGGGGGGARGGGGGAVRGGGSFGGVGFGRGIAGNNRVGFGFSGLRGYGYGYGYGRGYGRGYGSLYYPYLGYGLGLGYWSDYYDPYYYGPNGYAGYGGGYGGGYASYQTSPNVTVIYPQQTAEAAPPPPPERANPVTREYDQYGQEVRPGVAPGGGSPVYLIAFNDHVIRAAAAYWVDGKTVHYVTLQHEEKQAPLDTVDRSLSMQLNRERQVPFQLPVQ
jgi:hypothetical protein